MSTRDLLRVSTRGKIRTALQKGEIVANGGGYALITADQGLRAAARLNGVMSHLSAAAHWGWELKTQPDLPTVTVPRGRKIDPRRRRGVHVKWRPLHTLDNWGIVATNPVQTVIDCARDLPFDEALAVADSALRHCAVTRDRLEDAALKVPTAGRAAAIRVATHADAQAANPFESVLRAIALDVNGLSLVPQVRITDGPFRVRPDLVDENLRIVVEADSFGFHSSRSALRKDCQRYVGLSLLGWLVLRFSWEDVMFEPDYVRVCLERAVGLQRPIRLTPLAISTPKTA